VHLNVEWRDLPAEAWHHKVKTVQGRTVPAEESVWMRTREVWMHAVDLDNGATFADIPTAVLDRLLTDITGAWHTRGTDAGLLIKVDGAGTGMWLGDTSAADPTIISGPLPAAVQWAAGRGTAGMTANLAAEGTVPAPPQWI
jgi:maleylpyruvate isomerase